MRFTYDDVTKEIVETLLELTRMAGEHVGEGQSAYWHMGQGAVMHWHRLVGQEARIDDCQLLEVMLDDIPGKDDLSDGLIETSSSSTAVLLARLSAQSRRPSSGDNAGRGGSDSGN